MTQSETFDELEAPDNAENPELEESCETACKVIKILSNKVSNLSPLFNFESLVRPWTQEIKLSLTIGLACILFYLELNRNVDTSERN